jgi:tetratricopeptide (TPR) repeat protein
LEDLFTRGWDHLLGRLGGMLSLRFLIQPSVSALIGVIAGVRDAQTGRPAYFISIFTDGQHRQERLRECWSAVWKVLILAIVLDVVYEMLARQLLGDFSGARASFTEALRLAHAVGAQHLAASVAACLASNEYDAGDFETALRLKTEAVRPFRRLGLSALIDVASSVNDIAKDLIALGRYDEARARAREALEVAREVRYPVIVAGSLQQLAVLALLRPHIESGPAFVPYAAAAHIFGFFDARWATLGIPRKYGLPEYDGALELLRSAIGQRELTRLMAVGATMAEDEAIAQAHALE